MSELNQELFAKVIHLETKDLEALKIIAPLMERFESEITRFVFERLQQAGVLASSSAQEYSTLTSAHSVWFAGLLDPTLADERWRYGLAVLYEHCNLGILEVMLELLRQKVLQVLTRESKGAAPLESYASFLKCVAFDAFRLRTLRQSPPAPAQAQGPQAQSQASAMPTSQAQPAGPLPVVLIVEDDPAILRALVRGVKRIDGIEVFQAEGYAEGLRLLEQLKPSVLVSDFDLVDGKGSDFLPILPKQAGVIFVTGHARFARGSAHQFRSDVIVLEKPVPLDVLRASIRDLLKKA